MAASFGWDLAAYRDSGQLVFSYVPMGDLDLGVLATAARSEMDRSQVSRIVIDSLSELAFAAREEDRFAACMRSLVDLIRAGGSSLLLTSETSLHGLPGNSLARPTGTMPDIAATGSRPRRRSRRRTTAIKYATIARQLPQTAAPLLRLPRTRGLEQPVGPQW